MLIACICHITWFIGVLSEVVLKPSPPLFFPQYAVPLLDNVIAPIGKANRKVAFICKHFYMEVLGIGPHVGSNKVIYDIRDINDLLTFSNIVSTCIIYMCIYLVRYINVYIYTYI